MIFDGFIGILRIILALGLFMILIRSFKVFVIMVLLITAPIWTYYAVQQIPSELTRDIEPLIPKGIGQAHYVVASISWQLLFYKPVQCFGKTWELCKSVYRLGNVIFVKPER